MAQGEQTGSENTPDEFSGEPNELPGEPIPGTGPGTGGSGQQSVMASIEAMAFALQSLQLATEAHAQAMAQQRSKIIMSDTQGNQMNSSDGEYQVAPVAEVGDLPDFDQTEEDDWVSFLLGLLKIFWKPNVKGHLKITGIRCKHTFKQWQIKQEPPKNDGELSD